MCVDFFELHPSNCGQLHQNCLAKACELCFNLAMWQTSIHQFCLLHIKTTFGRSFDNKKNRRLGPFFDSHVHLQWSCGFLLPGAAVHDHDQRVLVSVSVSPSCQRFKPTRRDRIELGHKSRFRSNKNTLWSLHVILSLLSESYQTYQTFNFISWSLSCTYVRVVSTRTHTPGPVPPALLHTQCARHICVGQPREFERCSDTFLCF